MSGRSLRTDLTAIWSLNDAWLIPAGVTDLLLIDLVWLNLGIVLDLESLEDVVGSGVVVLVGGSLVKRLVLRVGALEEFVGTESGSTGLHDKVGSVDGYETRSPITLVADWVIIRELKKIYETKKDSMKITSYSNFFKSEPIYELILKDFDELDEWDTEKVKDCMVIFEKKKEKYIWCKNRRVFVHNLNKYS